MSQVDSIENAGIKENLIRKQLINIDNIIGELHTTSKDLMPQLIFQVDSLDTGNKIKLEEIPQTNSFQKKDISVQTNAIILSGSFKDLVILTNNLESCIKSQKLISMKYYSQNNYYYEEPELFCKLYFQSYCKSDSTKK